MRKYPQSDSQNGLKPSNRQTIIGPHYSCNIKALCHASCAQNLCSSIWTQTAPMCHFVCSLFGHYSCNIEARCHASCAQKLCGSIFGHKQHQCVIFENGKRSVISIEKFAFSLHKQIKKRFALFKNLRTCLLLSYC